MKNSKKPLVLDWFGARFSHLPKTAGKTNWVMKIKYAKKAAAPKAECNVLSMFTFLISERL
jgi:hypothetical protein